jgi:hypothetical protein
LGYIVSLLRCEPVTSEICAHQYSAMLDVYHLWNPLCESTNYCSEFPTCLLSLALMSYHSLLAFFILLYHIFCYLVCLFSVSYRSFALQNLEPHLRPQKIEKLKEDSGPFLFTPIHFGSLERKTVVTSSKMGIFLFLYKCWVLVYIFCSWCW